ncbi:hypothetical protein [Brevibacterium oceani]|nr:hypothetical protein [Brevibacterium oceani]
MLTYICRPKSDGDLFTVGEWREARDAIVPGLVVSVSVHRGGSGVSL